MKRSLTLLVLLPLGLWSLFALPALMATDPGFWDIRRAAIILCGLLALWWMSTGMLLAARPRWLEQALGGLDKLYRWHKQIGIGAGCLVLTHWMLEWLPKKMVRLGWLEPRPRGPKGSSAPWLDLAKEVGEWAGYILLALVVIALLRRIPYHYFRRVHKLFGIIFLAGAFHGLMLLPTAFWATPLGWAMAVLAVAGSLPALASLTNRIGRSRQYAATIEAIQAHADHILEISCRLQSPWPGHRPGQFLLADFACPGEGAHPFTIASHWNASDTRLTLAVKALGDFTQTLATRLHPGQALTLEGPYGCFDFSASSQVNGPQIWIAGGIGITPFLAKLGERAEQSKPLPEIDLFYCTRQAGDFPENLEQRCQAAGVRLHRRLTERDGPLDPADLGACLQSSSSVWFCGPAAWGENLEHLLVKHGLARQNFHREAFEFR